jgi:hypothetical protein
MKINPQNASGVSTSASAESTGPQSVNRSTEVRSRRPGSLAEDRLELSGLVDNLAKAEAAGVVERAGYVRALAKLYRSGGYATDASAVGRKIVQEALANRATGSESE